MPDSTFVDSKHHERMILRELDRKDFKTDFIESVDEGLSASPKYLSPKFFYDETGSKLFEAAWVRVPKPCPCSLPTAVMSIPCSSLRHAPGSLRPPSGRMRSTDPSWWRPAPGRERITAT